MKSAEEIIEQFIEPNGITFELRAINSDDEVIAKYSSNISADDVSMFANLIDKKIEDMALEDSSEDMSDYYDDEA